MAAARSRSALQSVVEVEDGGEGQMEVEDGGGGQMEVVIYQILPSAILCRSLTLLRPLLLLLPFRYPSIIILTPSFILSVILFLLSPYSLRTVFRIPAI